MQAFNLTGRHNHLARQSRNGTSNMYVTFGCTRRFQLKIRKLPLLFRATINSFVKCWQNSVTGSQPDRDYDGRLTAGCGHPA